MRKQPISIVLLFFLASSVAFADWDAGVAAFTKKDYQTAAAEFQGVVDSNPDAFQGHYMLGLSLGALKKHDQALNHLRKAYDLNPNDLSIKIELGKSYISVRRYADAAKLLGTVSSGEIGSLDDRKKIVFLQLRASARERANDDEAAFADYKQLASLKPNDAKIQLKYAFMASQRDQISAADRAFDRAVKADSKSENARRSYITFLKKKGRMERDKNAKRQIYLKAANLAKQLSSTYDNQLLKCEVELGATAYAEAVTSCQSASAKKSNDWLALYYLGQAYSSNKQFAEAEEPLGKAAGLATGDDQKKVWQQLGFVYEKQKNYSASIEHYEKASDQRAAARVKENERVARENTDIERHNQEIEQMRKEAEELEKQLKELEEGGGGTP